MRSLRASIVLVTILAAIPAALLWGQAPDSAVFHRRQWGVDFNIGGGFVGAGLIHFSSPTRALVLNVSGFLGTYIPDDSVSASGNESQVTISLGARRYRSITPSLFFYRTLGIEGNYQHQFHGGANPYTVNENTAGLFGELGAGWLVTPHLGLGAAWRISVDYGRAEAKGPGSPTTKTHSFSVSLGQVRLTGQLYF